MTLDRTNFIKMQTRLRSVPYVPEISLYTADEATELWQKTETELSELQLPPPFWAFPWAGGQALARYVLDEPQTVRHRQVLDFASGSGLVAIAAAQAGAEIVQACEIDAFAVTSIELNAIANNVKVVIRPENLIGQDHGWDTILAGDICYERDLAAQVIAWLTELAQRGATVLIGDPGRAYLPQDKLETVATYEIPVCRSIEDAPIKRTSVWRFKIF